MFNIDIILKSLNEVGLTLLFIFLGILILEVVLYVVLEKIFKYRFALAFMLLSPAIIGLGALEAYPLDRMFMFPS